MPTSDSWNRVETPHYDGPSLDVLSANLFPKDGPYTAASARAIKQSVAFKYASNGRKGHPKTVEDQMAYDLEYSHFKSSRDGKNYVAFRTDGRTIAISEENYQKKGPFFEQDDSDDDGWMSVGHRKDFAISSERYGKRTSSKFNSFEMGTNEILVDELLGKYITQVRIDGSPEELGKRASQSYTWKKSVEEYMQSEEGQAMLEMGVETPEYVGVKGKKGILASIGRYSDGKVAIYTGSDIYKHLKEEASHNHASIDDILRTTIGEEMMHSVRRSYDLKTGSIQKIIAEEIATKAQYLSLLETLLESSTEESERVHYRAQIRAMKEDLRTTAKRYQKLHGSRYSQEQALREEAQERGLRGEEADRYVNERIAEYSTKTNDANSKYASKKAKNSKDRAKQEKKQETKEGQDDQDAEQGEDSKTEESQDEGNESQKSSNSN